jgi:hypothetical protein
MSLAVAPWVTERFDVDVKLSSPAGVFFIYWLTHNVLYLLVQVGDNLLL